MAKESDKSDIKQDKALIKVMIHKHEKHDHPGKPLTKLAKGGKTSMQMKTLGRGLAKVANQKSGSKIKKSGI
jgi:hypothetical protein